MNKRNVIVILLLSFIAALIFTAVPVHGAATISTDKLDYTPGERVAIFGSGFSYNVQVTVSVTRPDSTVNTIRATTDWSGAFTCLYQLDGIMGTYTVKATDGTNAATTTFTDGPSSFSVHLITVNGVPYPWPMYVSNPVEFYGNFSAHPGVGQEKQYGIMIDWGDGSNTSWRWSDTGHANPYLTWDPLDQNTNTFNGTFNTNPGGGYPDMGHTYAIGGLYTQSILFYHGQTGGTESVDALFTLDTTVLIPEISVSKSGPTSAHEGDSITYTITVTNPSSDTTMYKVSVIDSILGDISGSFSASLAPLASETKTFNYMVPTTGSNITNTVTVTYKDLANEAKTASASWTVIIQYFLTVNSPHDTPGGAGWYNGGSTAYATLVDGVVSGGSGIRYVFTGWSGDASGTGLMSNGILMDGSKTATAQWKTQYYIAFSQSGVGSDYAGTVVTIDGTSYDRNGAGFWWDANLVHTFSFASPLSVAGGKQYAWTSTSGLSTVQTGSLTVTGSGSVAGNYKTQYYVTFDETGVGSDFTGTVVTIDGVNYAVAGLPVSFWYDSGSSHSFSFASPLTVDAGKKYVWSSTSGLSTVQTGSLTATASGSVVGNYIVQNAITFDQIGVGPDFTGTVVTVDSVSYGVSSLPHSFYWPLGSTHSFAFQSPLVVTANAKRYLWTGTTGLSSVQSGSITVTTYGDIVGNFKTQYYLALATSPSGVDSPTGAGWYDGGTYASISTTQYVDIVPGSSRYNFTGWQTTDMLEIADSSATSTTVLMDKAKIVTAAYVVQYYITFGQSGVGSDYAGTVITIDGTSYDRYGVSFWWDVSSVHTFSFASPLSVTGGKQYAWTSTSGLSTVQSGSLTVTGSGSVTGNYKTQYYVTFDQTGVGSDFTGTVVTIDGTTYAVAGLQVSFWYDSGSSHSFSFASPLTVEGGFKQYAWDSTSGLSTVQTGSLTATASGSVVGNYILENAITFDQTGIGSDFTGTVVTVDSVSYGVSSLPISFYWPADSTHSFAFQSPLVVTANAKRYVWTSTSGLSSVQSDSITVTTYGSIVGNFKTQYYLALATSPSGVDSPTGAGWYDGGTYASISTTQYVDIVPGSSRYSLTGWTTGVMGEIADPSSASTTVFMDQAKTVTAAYVVQYYITFGQSGVGSDYAGTVVTIDGTSYDRDGAAFWWDANSVHTFSFASPLSVAGGKQYMWTSTSGLSTVQTGSLTVTGSGSVTGNYKTQYYVIFEETGVGSDFTGTVVTIDGTNYGLDGLSVSFWYDGGSSHSFSFASPLTVDAGKQYAWSSTSGLLTVQAGSLTVATSGTVVGNYILENAITFDQTGIGSDFTGTVVTVDGIPYGVSSLPISFYWPADSTHSFAFQSPLVVTANAKRYVWTSTSGLSSVQSDSITVTTYGSIVGNFKTQYYLILATSPSGVDSPTGAGWYDGGTYASISTTQYVDIVPGSSRYSLTGWTTGVMGEIADPSSASTTVFMDQAKTVTANYVTQYYLTVRTSPLGVDSPAGEDWYDAGSSASISTAEYVDIVPGSSRYRFNGWNTVDMSEIVNPSLASTTVHMDKAKTVTANYVTQYYLTMSTNFGTVSPGDGWHDAGSTVTISATPPSAGSGERYVWNGWTGSGSGSYTGTANPATVTMNAAITETASWTHQYFLTVNSLYDTPGGAGWYNGGSTAYATLVDGVVSGGSGIRYVFTGWSGDASGTGLMSNGILMDGSKTATAQWKTQYYIAFSQSGVGSDYAGTVVTIDGTSYDRNGAGFWWDANLVHTFSFASPLSVAGGKQYAWTSTSGLSTDEFGSLTVTGSGSVAGNYKTQYYVTFDETGVGSDFTGTVVTIDGVNYAVAGLPVSFWYDGGSSHSFSFASPLTVDAGKQYAWDSTSGLSTVQTGSLTATASGSVVGNYILENAITFDQTGIGSDFTGTVVTVDGIPYGVSSLPHSFYWPLGSTHSFAFQSPLVVAANVKRYLWTGTTGLSSVQSGSITVTTYGDIVGNFKTQYYLALATSPSGVDSPTGAGWYDGGTYASISTDEYVDIVSGSRYCFNGWITGFMSEISNASAASTTVFMDQAETVTAVYVIQYYIVFGQSGVGLDYGGVVVTIDGTSYGRSGASFWWDVSSVHTFSFASPLSVAGGKQYAWTSTSGLSTVQSGSLTVTGSGSVTGNYKTQYYVTFDQTGVGSDFTGTVVTIDGTTYAVAGLQVSFWYDSGSSHSFSFASPLSVSAGKQYAWSSTSGLSSVQIGSLTVAASGSVVGNYIVQNAITFDQLGVGSDFTGTVVIVDGASYGVSSLPHSFYWPLGSTHSFAFQSPLVVAANVKQYVWTGASGLSSVQSGSITVATYGSIVGSFKTQYYLALATSPSGVDSPTGVGWYDSGTYASIATAQYVDIVPGSSRYSFTGWTTGVMGEIADPSIASTTVFMDKGKIVTANYVIQYYITFDQSGVGSDFTGTVVTVDGIPYGVSSLPISFYWPADSTHSFAFQSPLAVTQYTKRYVWTSTSGLSSVQSGLMTVTTFGSMVGNFKIQYYLFVKTDPPDFVAITGQGWYDSGNTLTLTAPAVAGPEKNSFWYWDVDIVSQGRNVNNITVTMNMAHTATAHYWVPGVGGEWIPIRAVQLLTLCIGFAATMVLAASFVGIRRFKKRQV